jgi:hypothetical protein
MTPEEAVASLNATNETLVKIGTETDSLLQKIADLEAALAAAIEAGRTITPELEAAVAAVSTQANAVDALVPDAPPPPPAPSP